MSVANAPSPAVPVSKPGTFQDMEVASLGVFQSLELPVEITRHRGRNSRAFEARTPKVYRLRDDKGHVFVPIRGEGPTREAALTAWNKAVEEAFHTTGFSVTMRVVAAGGQHSVIQRLFVRSPKVKVTGNPFTL